MKKNTILTIFSIVCIFSTNVLFGADKFTNKILAKVGKETILLTEFNDLTLPIIEQYKKERPDLLANGGEEKLKEDMLNQMIDERVLLLEARKNKVSVTKVAIDKAVNEIKDRFKTEDEFQAELKKSNLKEVDFRKQIEKNLMISSFIDNFVKSKVVAPTDEEAKKYYNEHHSEMIVPETVRVRHILMKTAGKKNLDVLNKMRELRAKIVKDKTKFFSDYAMEYSEDETTKENGGDTGLFTRGRMELKAFEDKAFSLNVGQISDVFETKLGYHIMKCEEKKAEEKRSFNNAKNSIKGFLYNVKIDEELKKVLENAKKNIEIVKNI